MVIEKEFMDVPENWKPCLLVLKRITNEQNRIIKNNHDPA